LSALGELADVPARESQREAGQATRGGLFDDRNDARPGGAQMGGNGEEERAGSGDDDALRPDIEARFYECLQASGAEDAGKGPAREREEELARACGQDERTVLDIGECACVLDPQGLRRGRVDRASPEADLDERLLKAMNQARGVGIALVDTGAPDLAAGGGIVIHQADTHSCFGRRSGGNKTAGPCSYHKDIDLRSHPVKISIPSRQRIWHVR